jgi:hypothetical protein
VRQQRGQAPKSIVFKELLELRERCRKETTDCAPETEVVSEAEAALGASAELSVEMPDFPRLKLTLQLHYFRLARAVFQFEDLCLGHATLTQRCSLICNIPDFVASLSIALYQRF